MEAICHDAKTFVEHVKKMHKEGNRGFEEEFKVNEIKHEIIISLRTEMCVQTQVLCLQTLIAATSSCRI